LIQQTKRNPKELAKEDAISFWGLEWSLTIDQARVKFNHQPKKWQRKQVNKFLDNK